MIPTVRDLMEQAETFSNLVADAILKRTSPVRDDLSEREAKQAYGTRWLLAMKEKAYGYSDYRCIPHGKDASGTADA